MVYVYILVLWIASDEFPIGIFRSSHFRWQCGLMLIVILSKYCWVLLSLKECVCVCLGVLGACLDFCFFHLFAKHRVVFLDLSLGDRCWSNYQVVAGYFADVCPLQAHYFGRIYILHYISKFLLVTDIHLGVVEPIFIALSWSQRGLLHDIAVFMS